MNRFNLYSLTARAIEIAGGVAVLATLYLLYGLLFGNLSDFAHQTTPDQEHILSNLHIASSALGIALGLIGLLSAFLYFSVETAGYILVLVAAAVGCGIPFALLYFGGESLNPASATSSPALRQAMGAFPMASWVPGIVGLLLIGKDIALRFRTAVRERPLQTDRLAYGQDATRERNPPRFSLLGKCWEGPYCRENIRQHCPVFHARKACWRQKRGCYCEEDIVTTAYSKINGTLLPMAGESHFNFSDASQMGVGRELPQHKPQLSDKEKQERCRHCVIYNEHQREKYRILLPTTIVGTVGVYWLATPLLRGSLQTVLGSAGDFLKYIAVTPTSQSLTAAPAGITSEAAHNALAATPATVDPILVWMIVAGLGLIVLAKMLSLLEWAVFEKKV